MRRKIVLGFITFSSILGICSCKMKSNTGLKNSANHIENSKNQNMTEENISCVLKVWGPALDLDEAYGAWLNKRCEAFNEQHPNWNITYEYGICSESTAKQTITQDPMSAADIFLFTSTGLENLYEANCLYEFGGDYLETIKNDYSKQVVDCVTYEDGGVYGVPMTVDTYYMYYDKSVFSEEDVTSLETMLSKGKVAISINDGFYLSAFYLANGCQFYGPTGTDRNAGIDFTGEKAVQVTDALVDFVHNKNFIVASPTEALSMMRGGKVDAFWCGSWIAEQTKDVLGDRFGVAVLPKAHIGEQEVQLKPFSSIKAIGVKSTTKYPQVAMELAMFLGNYDSQKAHYELRNYIPCNLRLLEESEVTSNILVKINESTADISVNRPYFSKMSYYWTAAESFGQAIRDGYITHSNSLNKTEEFNKSVNQSGIK